MDKVKFTLTDLLICYAYNQRISERHLSKYLRDVCKIVRDNSRCKTTVTICRRFITLRGVRKDTEAIEILNRGADDVYISESMK